MADFPAVILWGLVLSILFPTMTERENSSTLGLAKGWSWAERAADEGLPCKGQFCKAAGVAPTPAVYFHPSNVRSCSLSRNGPRGAMKMEKSPYKTVLFKCPHRHRGHQPTEVRFTLFRIQFVSARSFVGGEQVLPPCVRGIHPPLFHGGLWATPSNRGSPLSPRALTLLFT